MDICTLHCIDGLCSIYLSTSMVEAACCLATYYLTPPFYHALLQISHRVYSRKGLLSSTLISISTFLSMQIRILRERGNWRGTQTVLLSSLVAFAFLFPFYSKHRRTKEKEKYTTETPKYNKNKPALVTKGQIERRHANHHKIPSFFSDTGYECRHRHRRRHRRKNQKKI